MFNRSRKLQGLSFAVAFSLIAISTVAASAQKNKKKTPLPEIVEEPQVMLVAESPKPANGSLFTTGSANGSLLSDFKPRQVGDLVFVDVVESSTANVTSAAKRTRDSGTLGGLTNLLSALPFPSAAAASSVASAMGGRKFDGKGSTERTSSVEARIVARVVEVLPNGDMRIEAKKQVNLNKEKEWLTLSGIIRARDVSSQNSIPTTQVGELRVELNGKGVASADNAPGWLFRLFDKLSPF